MPNYNKAITQIFQQLLYNKNPELCSGDCDGNPKIIWSCLQLKEYDI